MSALALLLFAYTNVLRIGSGSAQKFRPVDLEWAERCLAYA